MEGPRERVILLVMYESLDRVETSTVRLERHIIMGSNVCLIVERLAEKQRLSLGWAMVGVIRMIVRLYVCAVASVCQTR